MLVVKDNLYFSMTNQQYSIHFKADTKHLKYLKNTGTKYLISDFLFTHFQPSLFVNLLGKQVKILIFKYFSMSSSVKVPKYKDKNQSRARCNVLYT